MSLRTVEKQWVCFPSGQMLRNVEIDPAPKRWRMLTNANISSDLALCLKLCPVAAWTGLVASGGEVLKPAFLLANPNASKLR